MNKLVAATLGVVCAVGLAVAPTTASAKPPASTKVKLDPDFHVDRASGKTVFRGVIESSDRTCLRHRKIVLVATYTNRKLGIDRKTTRKGKFVIKFNKPLPVDGNVTAIATKRGGSRPCANDSDTEYVYPTGGGGD